MDWHNLEAGKKAAQEQAPDPVDHVPEAPIISEEEAQVIESSEDQQDEVDEKDDQDSGVIDKILGDDDTVPEEGSVRVRPHRNE